MIWKNINNIVKNLETTYGDEFDDDNHLDDIHFDDLHSMIISLENVDFNPDEVDEEFLEEVLNMWVEYRNSQ